MQFRIRTMTEDDATCIVGWRYGEPYAIYNLSPEDIGELLDPAQGYLSAVDETGRLVGFLCFGIAAQVPGGDEGSVYAADALDVGLGLRPDFTGQGLGPGFLRAGIDFARAAFGPCRFRLSVATFNERAIRAYRKAGFESGPRFVSRQDGRPPLEFLLMELAH